MKSFGSNPLAFILSINVKPSTLFERDGEDIYVTVGISYSVAVLGGEIEVPTVEKNVKVRVRAGTQSGSMMRLKSKGITSIHRRGRGDQYIRIVVSVPDRLTREQKHLLEELRKEGI